MMWMTPQMLWAQHRKNYPRVLEVGRRMMGSSFLKTRGFGDYEPGARDVFVCTYSKSGTYWMLQVVTQIAGRGAAEFEHIHDLVPWPEIPVPGLIRLREPTWELAPAKMRAIKTHAEAPFVPYGPEARYIVVVRDPKDALVSGYYFADSIFPGLRSLGLEAWTEAFVEGQTPFCLWAEHIAGFWPWRTRANVEFVTFAEMKRELGPVVDRIAALMGVELSEDERAAVVERSGFPYMKAHEVKFRPPSPSPGSPTIELIRKGKTGEAAELLSPECLAEVDARIKAQLEALGSDFPYDEFFPAK